MSKNHIKAQLVYEVLQTGKNVFIHLNPKHYGVVVPLQHMKKEHLVLQFGYNMPVNIADLNVTNDSITGTLSFSQVPFKCIVPWEAVFAIVREVDGLGKVFEEDMPESVKQHEQKLRHETKLVEEDTKNKNVLKFPSSPLMKNKVKKDTDIKKKRTLPSYLRIIK